MSEDLKERLLLAGSLILVLFIGFFSGRLSVRVEKVSSSDPIREVGQISTFVPTINFLSFDKGILYGKSNGKDLRIFVHDTIVDAKTNGEFFIDTSGLTSASTVVSETYQYVASKNSTKYHPIGSSGANSIKLENRVYFQSKEEAEKAGFQAASDVK